MRQTYRTKEFGLTMFRGWLKSPVAQVLVLALVISSMPVTANAKYRDNSGSLPGMVSTGTIVAIAAAGAAAIGLMIYFGKRSRGPHQVKLEAPPVKFNEFVPGQPTKKTVPVTNIMNEAVTVKAVLIEDKSGVFTLDAHQTPFTLAPGERFEIPVSLAAKKDEGKARVRIVATTAKLNKDVVKYVDISYGRQKSKFRKLVPGI